MSPRRIDLDPDSRRALEFDELLEWLASFAATGQGAARIRASYPSADSAVVAEQIEALIEARSLLATGGALVGREIPDPREAIEALRVEGLSLSVGALRGLSSAMTAADEAGRRLRELDASAFPRLREVSAGIPDLGELPRRLLGFIDPDGRISDSASPELGRIRESTARASERLRQMLLSMLRDPQSEAVIRDDFITRRNGRFVIPVRVDAPRPVRGIVHGSSSSGATRFVEPLESIDWNNDLVRLEEQQRIEIERLLAEWTGHYRSRLEQVARAADALTRLDLLQARVRFGQATAGIPPTVVASGPLRFRGLRHPMLDRRLRESGESCVPLDLELDPADRVLVLSGPNTGGKTVALKAFGLGVLMAQAGIPVPADDVTLPLFEQVRADIGDHQSIDADLSTFSAHVGAAAGFLAAKRAPALFLFDEIGTGTEPTEGAALAQAVLEAAAGPGVTTIVTTHHAALKAWAFTEPAAVSAAMEFDAESMRPTYRIVPGAAGASAGLDIAAALGIGSPVVERARSLLGGDRMRGEAYMERLRELTTQAEELKSGLLLERAELEARRERFERNSREQAEALGRRGTEALDRVIREFRSQMRKELQAARDRSERKRIEREFSRAEAGLRMERARALEGLPGGGRPATASREAPARVVPGMRVWVLPLAREGEVRGIRGEKVDVLLGTATFTVQRSDLRLAGPASPEDRPAEPRQRRSPTIGAPEVPRELKLVGMRVEEALEELDRYLDRATLAGHDEVRVIHGHGTGRLRSAVREFLRSQAQVASQRAGKGYEGGDGATVVRLREDSD